MAINYVNKYWVLPTTWRDTLGPQVQKLGVPELDAAFTRATEILASRTESEVQEIADHLLQSIAVAKGTIKINVPGPDPRAIYEIHCTEGQTPQEVPFMDRLAVGTLLALATACRSLNEVKTTHQEHADGRALAAARAFSEWLYIVHLLKSNEVALELLFHRQIRAATKKKIKKKKSETAVLAAQKIYGPDKALICKYFDDNNLDSMSAAKAAEKITAAKLTTAGHFTIYKYLLAYKKKKVSEK